MQIIKIVEEFKESFKEVLDMEIFDNKLYKK
jgi:hypothetical protein